MKLMSNRQTMSSTVIKVLLIAGVALLAICSGDDDGLHQRENQFLIVSTDTPQTIAQGFGTTGDDRSEQILKKLKANQLISGPLLASRGYFNYWRPRQRRRRYQRLTTTSSSRPQWMGSTESQSHNQRITSNNFDIIKKNNINFDNNNNNIKNNHLLDNQLSDDNSNSLLPERHIRRPKQIQSSTSGSTKSSKSSSQQTSSVKPMATVSRGTRGARQYDIPQIGESSLN